MPRLDADGDVETHPIGGNFSFTGARIANLGATEYTLVDIEVDMSTSVRSFLSDLLNMLDLAVDACRKSPRADNLLVRVATFSSAGIKEVHGFVPLADIDRTKYSKLTPGGWTPLYDACYVGAKATNEYAKKLADADFLANGIMFVITDGENNDSAATVDMVAVEMQAALRSETLESHVSILIGINTKNARVTRALAQFRADAGMTQFVDAGDATPQKLAKLAAFVSQSVSSTGQALGTGGPSQQIAATV